MCGQVAGVAVGRVATRPFASSNRWRLRLLLRAMAFGAYLEEIRYLVGVVLSDLDLLGHDRAANQEALGLVTIVLLQKVILPRVLDALRHDAQIQAVRHLNDRLADGSIALVARQSGDERAIDLEDVERQALDQRQARMARAEIVDSDLHTHR